MNFIDDPRRLRIEPMHELMENWARWGKDERSGRAFPRQSSTLKIMEWMRDHAKNVKEDEGNGPVESKGYRPSVDVVSAMRVELFLRDRQVWAFHQRYRDVLTTYYLKCHYSMPIGKIAHKLGCKPWRVDAEVKDALFYLSKVWRN